MSLSFVGLQCRCNVVVVGWLQCRCNVVVVRWLQWSYNVVVVRWLPFGGWSVVTVLLQCCCGVVGVLLDRCCLRCCSSYVACGVAVPNCRFLSSLQFVVVAWLGHLPLPNRHCSWCNRHHTYYYFSDNSLFGCVFLDTLARLELIFDDKTKMTEP